VLVHCGAGKDRTGIVSALVELLVGVPEEDIVADYLRSGQDTRPDRIAQTLAYIRKQGGIQAYLANCGFNEENQQAFIARFGIK
jgi:protein tyrosine/serine phosphatase